MTSYWDRVLFFQAPWSCFFVFTTKEHQLSQPFEKLLPGIILYPLPRPFENNWQSVPCVINLINHVNWNTMKFMYTVDAIPVVEKEFSLHLMVNRLIVSTMPMASRQQCVIANEIQPGFIFEANERKLFAVTGDLLDAVIDRTRDCTIAISAKQIGHVTLLHLKVDSRLYNRSFANRLSVIQETALKSGISVSVTSFRNNITTLAIGFMNYNTVN